MHFTPRLLLAVMLASIMILGAVSVAGAEEAATGRDEIQLIVKARPAAAAAAVAALDDRIPVEDERRLAGTQLTTVTVPATQAEQALARLKADPRVEYAEHDAWVRAALTPSDPDYTSQWGIRQTGVDALWDTTTGAASTVIAVIDSGVNQSHPDFSGATFVPGYNFVGGNTDTADDHGHGTMVAGVIAAQHNTSGTAGVCPRCAVMPVKALDSNGDGSHAAVAAAVDHAVANGAKIINLSLSGTGVGTTRTLADAVAAAAAEGVLVLGAAGNKGKDEVNYPAGYPGVVAVAGSAPDDTRYSWSNFGSWVHVAAPGCNYGPKWHKTTNTHGYGSFCGTSSATPFVAGVAGLLSSTSSAPDAATLSRVLQGSAAFPAALADAYTAEGRVAAAAAHAALADVEAPAAAITGAPADWVRGSVELTATATDGAGVKRVEFLVDDKPAATALSAPYRVMLDTTKVADGHRSLRARAVDTAGLRMTTEPVSIGIDNTAPVVAITAPGEGQTVSGTVTLAADVGDVSPVSVSFAVDGTIVAEDTTAPYSATLDTTTLGDGSKTLTVTAVDAVALSTSTGRSFTVTAPVSSGGGGGTGGGGGSPTPTTSESPSPSPSPSASPTPAAETVFTEAVVAEAAAGDTVRSDATDETTADRPLQVALTTPVAGGVSIRRAVTTSTTPPRGYRLLDVETVITAPVASADDPLLLEFRIDGSVLDDLGGGLQVLRNGAVVAPCMGAGATPDPCLAARSDADGDTVATVRTSRASTWNFALATAACPGGGAASFDDVTASNAHAPAIACAADLGVARGIDASRYGPSATVTRAQMATFVVNALSAAGHDLPRGRDAFGDDDGNTHEAAINRLAAADIVGGVTARRYAPSATVTREQMTTFLVRAYEHMSGGALPAGRNAFRDDDGRPHEANIDKAAAAGFASGITASRFAPAGAVRRDQMASFLVRALDKAVADGVARSPRP